MDLPKNESLFVKSIELRNFRNYPQVKFQDLENFVIFLGENAIGKTNVIEAISLAGNHHSFRTNKSEQLILWGEEYAQILIELKNDYRLLNLEVLIKPGMKIFKLNGKPRSLSDLKSLIPVVSFTPDDLLFIKGSQNNKRMLFDRLGSQLSPAYYNLRRDYEKILKQKNKLLKQHVSNLYLSSVNDVFVNLGAQCSYKRQQLLLALKPHVQKRYKDIAGINEVIDMKYIPSWNIENKDGLTKHEFSLDEAHNALLEAIETSINEERRRGRSLFGPQRDQIEFLIDGKNVLEFASQGQIRSLVLAYKLAELDYLEEILNKTPLLLLDDVMGELDEKRRECFLDCVSSQIQTFITTTHLDYFPQKKLEQAQVINLPLEEVRNEEI